MFFSIFLTNVFWWRALPRMLSYLPWKSLASQCCHTWQFLLASLRSAFQHSQGQFLCQAFRDRIQLDFSLKIKFSVRIERVKIQHGTFVLGKWVVCTLEVWMHSLHLIQSLTKQHKISPCKYLLFLKESKKPLNKKLHSRLTLGYFVKWYI